MTLCCPYDHTYHLMVRMLYAQGEVASIKSNVPYEVYIGVKQTDGRSRGDVMFDRTRIPHWLKRFRYRASAFRPVQRGRGTRIVAVAPSRYDRRAQLVRWYSPSLGVAKRLHIYLPPDYASSEQRYPVLYLLRGHEREWLNLKEDRSRNGSNVLDAYEELLAAGRIGPLILVMPSLTSDDGVAHGIGVDNIAPWLAPSQGGFGTGAWERYLIQDLLPLVDTHWRTAAGGTHRGLAGFSIGGAVAAKLGAKYPWLFRTVSAYDGTFFYMNDAGSGARPDDSILENPIFDSAFGRPRDLGHVAANNAASLVQHGDAEKLRRITWMIQYGPEAIEPQGSNFYRGEHLVAALERRGLANALDHAVLHDGDHSWRTADLHMAQVLPLHWQALQPSLDGEEAEGA
jgi:S-formylglutathione hydrolase FrmB